MHNDKKLNRLGEEFISALLKSYNLKAEDVFGVELTLNSGEYMGVTVRLSPVLASSVKITGT